MTTRDEPLPEPPLDEGFEEVSPDFIIPGETLPGAVVAPDAEPTAVTTSRTGVAAPRAPEPEAKPKRVARMTPARPIEPARAEAAPELQPEPPRTDEIAKRPVPSPAPAPRRRSVLPVALLSLLVGAGGGFFAGRHWDRLAALAEFVASPPKPPTPVAAPAPAEAPEAEERDRPAPARTKRGAKPAKAAPKAAAPRATAERESSGEKPSRLDVTAPAGAEVFLDGKRIGRGSLTVNVSPGRHRIEVKVGKNRVGEVFDAEPGGTWTYEITSSK